MCLLHACLRGGEKLDKSGGWRVFYCGSTTGFGDNYFQFKTRVATITTYYVKGIYNKVATMFMPCIPSRPADIYTVRIEEHEAQTSLTLSLRELVVAAGGTFIVNLTEGPGFM